MLEIESVLLYYELSLLLGHLQILSNHNYKYLY